MPHRTDRQRSGLLVLSWSLALLGAVAAGAERPAPPPYFAITDVQVHTGTGERLEGATVVVADGLIEAVGTDVAIPADAWVIDGEGLHLFPGLFDAMTTLGQKQEESDDSGGRRGGRGDDGPVIRGPEDRPATTPWVDAADLVAADDGRIETWREAGFTHALTLPTEGFFPGQGAILALGSGEPKELIIASGVAHRINFRGNGGFRSFPGSLMGGISYVNQVLYDADHYARAQALYDSDPRGLVRPAYDRTLEPLRQAFERDQPFLMPAHHGREIDRVLNLARAHGLKPVLFGGHGAYHRVEALAREATPVVISLDWPEGESDRDPDAPEALRDLAHRRLAPAVPSMLAEADVPFAFASDSLAGPTQVFEGIRKAIDAGLDEHDALTALTLGAARILGVDEQLGSIEPGKIANLVLASALPWAEDAEVKAVFVDGHRFATREPSEEDEPPASDPSGTWSLTLQTPRGNRDMTAELEMNDDGKVTGELAGERGATPIEKGKMAGDRLSFKMTREMGGRSMEASYSLKIEADEAKGTMRAGPMTMDLVGTRTDSAPAGDDDSASDAPDVSLAEIREALEVMQSPVRTGGSFAITNARVWPVSGPILDDATVVVENGKITAVGSDVAIPRGAEVIDAEGGSVIPGIIDAHSHIAIEGGGNEGSVSVSSMVTIQDVLQPDDIAIYRALAGGVTTINVLHGSANPIGGGNAVIKLRWGQDADGLRFEGAMPGIKFALGENPKRSNFRPPPGSPERYPSTRMGVMDVIRQAFTEARAYRDDWRAHERAVEAGERRMPPRRDLKLERLVEILEGERLVHAHSYRADEILQLLRLAESYDFRIATLQHVLEGFKVADEIAAHGAGASTFSDWWGYKVEANDAIPHNAALMTERGVVVSINSDSSEEMRHLNHEAAKAIRWGGMSEIDALALVTLNPARQLGIDDRVGSIEVGKDADLVLYDGHPLSVRSVVQRTWVDGDLYFEIAADRERQATIESMRDRLAPSEDEAEEGENEAPAYTTAYDYDAMHAHAGTHYSCREIH